MKKFLCVFLSVLVIGSVFVLGLSAEDRVQGESDLVFLRSASDPDMVLAPVGIDEFISYLYDEEHYSYSHALDLSSLGSFYLFDTSSSSSVIVNHFYVSENVLYCFASGQPLAVESPYVIGFDSTDIYNFFIYTVGLSYSDISYHDSNTNIINASLDIGSSIFDIGGTIISFVTSSWITVLALVSFVLVLGFGVIRKIVKGV